MTNRGKKRALALCLSLALLVGLLPTAALADESPPACTNHPEHTAECGYSEGTPEIPCDKGCTATDESGAVLHVEECAYKVNGGGADREGPLGGAPAVEGTPCGHSCGLCSTVDSGPTLGTSGQNVQNATPSDAALSLSALASGTCGDPDVNDGKNVTWSWDGNGTLTISGTGTMADYTIRDLAARPWHSYSSQIQTVVIGDGVTTIGSYAFRGCANLERADIGSNVTTIGQAAFGECSRLNSAALPDSLKTIENYAFENCALTSVTIPKGVETVVTNAFQGCASLTSLTVDSGNTNYQSQNDLVLNKAGDTLLFAANGLTAAVIPDGVTTIGGLAFANCTALTSVTIPDGVTTIGDSAFDGCTALTSVTIPDSVTTIKRYAFSFCTALKTVTFGNGLTVISKDAFRVCTALERVTFKGAQAPRFESDGVGIYGNLFGEAPSGLVIHVPKGATGYDADGWPTAQVKEDETITRPAIGGVTVPASGAAPATAITETEQYTGTVTWSPGHGTFAPGTQYTATITLTAKPGYTLQGVAENFFTVAGATATNAADSGVITAVFPKTADTATAISLPVIPGVTAPVRGATPVTAITETAQYTGTVAWSPNPGAAFAADTAYTATITLTAKPGYTLQGVTENFFTVAGAATVTNAADSGVITAVFPATGSAPSGGGNSDSDDNPSPTEQAVSKVEKAKDGDTVKVELPSGAKLPGKVLEAAAGKDVTLEIDAGKGVTWIINGKDIPKGKLSDLNLKVDAKANTIPVTVLNALTGEQKVMQLALSHNGAFDFPLTLRLETGKENAGLFANLYYYNEKDKALEYQSTAKIGADGNADLPFDHASSYAVVIDEASHAPAVWENPFTDVKESDWFYEAVAYVHHKGLMTGTGETAFSPGGAVTRAQVWTVLARLDGEDTAGGDPWYAPARDWAVKTGVSDGTNPDGAVSREQLVTMLYRYTQNAGMDVSAGEDTNILSYDDALDLAEWAVPAFQWACGAGVVSGTSNTTLSPQAGATRAQLAAILTRLLEHT